MKKMLTLLATTALLCAIPVAADEHAETKSRTEEKVSVFVLDDAGNLRLTEGAVADIDACKVDAEVGGFTEPVFLIDDDGAMKLTEASTSADGDIEVRKCFSGPCNGGTCVTPPPGNVVLSCPTTGGPSCNSSQTCSCSCATGSAVNVCT